MIQLDLFTWRQKYVTSDGPIPVKMSTPAQRVIAHRHAQNTLRALRFIRRMGL